MNKSISTSGGGSIVIKEDMRTKMPMTIRINFMRNSYMGIPVILRPPPKETSLLKSSQSQSSNT